LRLFRGYLHCRTNIIFAFPVFNPKSLSEKKTIALLFIGVAYLLFLGNSNLPVRRVLFNVELHEAATYRPQA